MYIRKTNKTKARKGSKYIKTSEPFLRHRSDEITHSIGASMVLVTKSESMRVWQHASFLGISVQEVKVRQPVSRIAGQVSKAHVMSDVCHTVKGGNNF